MNGKVLALCDTEEEYAQHMTEFLKEHKEIPWEIYTYTNVEEMVKWLETHSVELVVIAENAYTETVRSFIKAKIILLNETGLVKWNNIPNINKYQAAEDVFHEILQQYLEIAQVVPLPKVKIKENTRLIGMYSPIRRCLQTSFALTLAQMLSKQHKTLYLNFEHYAGMTELLPDIQTRDLADLLYFLTADKERFSLRFQTVLCKKGTMDYIPPMKAGQNLLSITPQEWQSLLKQIAEWGEYEYIILDLTESMQGLFEILRMCCKVFTLTRGDCIAEHKIIQYEQVLTMYQYKDVIDKTYKCNLPLFHRIPEYIEELTKGELADYVRKLLQEVIA